MNAAGVIFTDDIGALRAPTRLRQIGFGGRVEQSSEAAEQRRRKARDSHVGRNEAALFSHARYLTGSLAHCESSPAPAPRESGGPLRILRALRVKPSGR